jgi:hypothetical protein
MDPAGTRIVALLARAKSDADIQRGPLLRCHGGRTGPTPFALANRIGNILWFSQISRGQRIEATAETSPDWPEDEIYSCTT